MDIPFKREILDSPFLQLRSAHICYWLPQTIPFFLGTIICLLCWPGWTFAQGDTTFQAAQPMPNIGWNHKLTVTQEEVAFEHRDAPAYTITIYGLDEQKVKSLLKKEWKGKGKKVSTKGEVNASEMNLQEIHDTPLQVLAKGVADPLEQGQLKLSVAFIDRGTPIGPETMPEPHQKAMDYMYDLSVKLNQAAVDEEISAQIKILDGYQKDYDKLVKAQRQLESKIQKAQAALDQAKVDIQQNDQAIQAKKEEIRAFEEAMQENRNAENQKLLSQKRKELSVLENSSSKFLKNISKNEAKIQEAQDALPDNQQARELANQKLAQQQLLVDQYRQKKKDVQ